MRTLCALLTLVAAIALCSRLHVQAQAAGQVLQVKIQDLDLTDDQEAKIADIRKEFRPRIMKAVEELATLVKGEVEKVRDVLTPAQKTQLQAMKDERMERKFESLCERIAHLKDLELTDAEFAKIEEIRKECRPRITKATSQLEGLLTAAQKQAREEALKAGKRLREVRQALNLTDEQKQKIEAVAKEVGAVVRDEMAQIHGLLTESQKEKLAVLKDEIKDRVRDRMAHRIMSIRDLNLTDAQKTAIANIRQDYLPRIHEAGNNLRATVREEVGAIMAVLKR
jgi:Spy/CpxP family protein refolding chaperone